MNFPVDEPLSISAYNSEELIAKTDESPLSIYENSRNFLPKALLAEMSLQSSRLAYKTAKGSLLPSISVGAGLSTNFYRLTDGSNYLSFEEQFKNKRGYYVGFSLNVPIFNQFNNSSQIKKAKSQLLIKQYDKELVMRNIYGEIEQAVADMNGQADEYYQAKLQVEAMSVAHDVNERKYKEGLISALELHTSSNRLFQSKVEKLNAQFKFYLKQKLVNYYKGKPLIN